MKTLRNMFGFLYQKDDARQLAWLRVAVGFVAVLRFTSPPRYYSWGDMFAGFPVYTFDMPHKYFLDVFSYSVWNLPAVDMYIFGVLELIGLICSVCFLLGLGTRFVGAFVAGLLFYMFGVSLFFANHFFYILALFLVLLVLAPTNRYYSLDALWRKKKDDVKYGVSVVRCTGVLVSAVYFFAGLGKFINPAWRNGDIMRAYMEYSIVDTDILGSILALLPPYIVSNGVVFVLFFLAFGFWYKPTKYIAAVLALGFHICIGLVSGIWIFGVLMVLLYGLCFFYRPLKQQ